MPRRCKVGRVLLAAWLVYAIGFHVLANMGLDKALTRGVLMRFWMQPNVLVAAWAGVGLMAQCPVDKLSFPQMYRPVPPGGRCTAL